MRDSRAVAVIGAGAAGLSAAWQLSRAGRQVIILEARQRAGGRILTHHPVTGTGAVELGAEFIHGTPEATLDLLEAAGVERLPLNGDHWRLRQGKLVPMEESSDELRKLLSLARKQKGDRSVGSFLDEVAGKAELRDAADWMRNLLQGFDAADPVRASLKAIVKEWSGDASTQAEQGRPVGGYGLLVDYMLGRLDTALVHLRLGATVQGVRWSRSRATVALADGDTIDANAVVVTVPLSILQLGAADPSAIRFDPPLDAKAAALAGLAMGPVHRVMLRFDGAVWEERLGGPVPAGTFFHAQGQPFPTFWTSEAGTYWLTAWCGGPPAARLGLLEDDAIEEQAVRSAATLFPGASVVEVKFHNWQRDPRALGAYSYVGVGGGTARRSLAKPLEGMLFFAGEATDTSGEAATVAGAILSGARAAGEVMGKGFTSRKAR